MKVKELAKRIYDEIKGINNEDLTTAERNIQKILIPLVPSAYRYRKDTTSKEV